MENVILVQNRSVINKVAAILIALWTIHPFYILYVNWFIYFKIGLILILLGVEKRYKFTSKGEKLQVITLLGFALFQKQIVKEGIDYVSVFKNTTSSIYSVRLFYNKEYKTILSSKNYYEVVNVSSRISHLLKIDFFNPFEDYEQY